MPERLVMAVSLRGRSLALSRTTWIRWLPVAAACAVLVLSVPSLGARDLWYDESFSVTSTNQLWTSLVQRSASMGLYYVLLAPWSQVSLEPFWLRLPSAIFAAAAVGLTSRFVFTYFGRRAGIWATALLVPMFGVIRYALETRSYSLVMLLTVGSWFLLFRLDEQPTRRTWLLWGLCAAALVYSHPLAGFVPASQLLAWRGRFPDLAASIRSSTTGWLTFGVLLLPMVATFGLRTGAHPGWVPPLGRDSISEGLTMMAGPRPLPQMAWAAALAGATWWVARSASTSRERDRWRHHALLLWLWVPPIALLLISLAQPMFVGRYITASVPAVAIVIALAISRIELGVLRTGLGCILIVALAPGIIALQRHEGHQWSEAISEIESQLIPGERHGVIFNYDEVRQPFELNAHGREVLARTVPVHPSEEWGTNLRYHEETTLSDLRATTSELDVLWEVAQLFADDTEPLHDDRHQMIGFCPTDTHSFSPGIVVTRFEPCP